LSAWLRDYLFFPIVLRMGSRAGYFAVWLTMFLVGMWHGASWNFVIYANIHASAMGFNRWNRTRERDTSTARKLLWPVGIGVFALVMAALANAVLLLPWELAIGVGVVAAAIFALVCWLPETNGKLNAALHIALTFHLIVV